MLEVLIRNWPLKLLALVLAFTLWVSVTEESQPFVQDLAVPLEITLADEFTLLGVPPTTATVRVRGPEAILRRIDPLRHEMELLVDLSGAGSGERQLQLSEGNLIGVPSGVEVAMIIPDRLSLEIEEKVRRELSVVPALMGDPPEGYAFYGTRVEPPSLIVEGPRSEVEALVRLRTDPIRLAERTAPFVARVGALPDSPEVRVLDPQLLRVRVEIDTVPVEQSFAEVPVVLAGQAFEAAASPSTLRVVLAGPEALLADIRPEQLRAVVDVSGLAPREEPHHLSTRVDFLDIPAEALARISVKSVSREKVSVRVSSRRITG